MKKKNKKTIRKIVFMVLGLFLIYFSVKTAFFLTEDNSKNKLKAFTTDGCSSFPDGTPFNLNAWRSCCVEHDKAYWKGGTNLQKEKADEELKNCVGKKGYPITGFLMEIGVEIGGTAYLPTSFRWGYGWDKFRGYEIK